MRRSLPKWLVPALALGLSWSVASGARADDAQRAKELFQQGTTLFDLGDFDKAIEAWQQGYKEKPDPGFLYNIGQAFRLKHDPEKAIFFYRGYLRNSPKATNRADVEQKIATLQKQLNEKAAPPPAPLPSAPPPVPSAPSPRPSPSPAPASPPVTRAPFTPPPVEAPPLVPPPAVDVMPPPAPPQANRPVDVSVGLGVDTWTSGVRGSAQPSFAFAVAGGYTFGGDAYGSSSFRLGAILAYTFLSETDTSVTPHQDYVVSFTALLLEPSVRIRLVPQRLYLTGGLGIGVLGVGGLRNTSSLLANPAVTISGSPGLLELRPAVGVELHVSRAWALFASPAIAYSPKGDKFYAAISRLELMLGLAYRL